MEEVRVSTRPSKELGQKGSVPAPFSSSSNAIRFNNVWYERIRPQQRNWTGIYIYIYTVYRCSAISTCFNHGGKKRPNFPRCQTLLKDCIFPAGHLALQLSLHLRTQNPKDRTQRTASELNTIHHLRRRFGTSQAIKSHHWGGVPGKTTVEKTTEVIEFIIWSHQFPENTTEANFVLGAGCFGPKKITGRAPTACDNYTLPTKSLKSNTTIFQSSAEQRCPSATLYCNNIKIFESPTSQLRDKSRLFLFKHL